MIKGTQMSELRKLSEGRDFIRTSELARLCNRSSQTIRKNYCLRGECFGIRPIKFSHILLWPINQIEALFESAQSPSNHPGTPVGNAKTMDQSVEKI